MRKSSSFITLLKPYLRHVTIATALLILLVLTNMAVPYFMKILIDDIFMSGSDSPSWNRLFYLLPILSLVYVLRNLFFYLSRMKTVFISEDVCFAMRKQLFEKLKQASIQFYHTNDPGGIGTRVMDDTFKIQSFIQEKFPTLILNILTAFVLLVILFKTSLTLATLCILVLPAQIFLYHFFKMHIKRSHASNQASNSAIYSNLLERFLGIEVVRCFNAEDREMKNFINTIQQSRDNGVKTQRFLFMQKVGADLLIGTSIVILLGTGAVQVKNGVITTGTFMMFFSYVGMFYPAVLGLLSGFSHLNKMSACLERVDELLQDSMEDRGKHDRTNYYLNEKDVLGDISFQDVTLNFEDESPALSNINLKIKAGEHVAITGPCGSGKTSLLHLLMRFVQPDSGRILCDGRDISQLNRLNLRNIIGLVPQEIYLFNAPVIENLRYAYEEATMSDLEEACRLSEISDLVDKLPDKIYSKIGGKGVKLSKGQKQAICLCRTILKNSPILALDEATSSIDKPTTKKIISNVINFMRKRTLIVVSHEAEIMKNFKRIIHLQYGKIAFDGTWEEYCRFMENNIN